MTHLKFQVALVERLVVGHTETRRKAGHPSLGPEPAWTSFCRWHPLEETFLKCVVCAQDRADGYKGSALEPGVVSVLLHSVASGDTILFKLLKQLYMTLRIWMFRLYKCIVMVHIHAIIWTLKWHTQISIGNYVNSWILTILISIYRSNITLNNKTCHCLMYNICANSFVM